MACPIAKAADEPLLVWYDNWLLGLSGGYANREALIQSSVTTFGNPLYYSRDASDNGWLAAVFGGYQAIHEKWLLGGEFNLEWQDIEKSHDYAFASRNVTATYRRKGMIDFSGRLGYAFCESLMPYVRLGVELSRDSLGSYFSGNSTSSVQLFNKAWIHRFLLGVGVEVPLPETCGISVRLEYDYHSKGKTIEDFGGTGIEPFLIEYYTAMQPRTYSGRVSVVWNFF